MVELASAKRADRRRNLTAWALGAVGVLVGAAIVTVAICPDDVCMPVGKPWGWPLDAFIAVSFLGAAGLISIQSATNRLAVVLGAAGIAKLVEMNLGEVGDVGWWHLSRMVLIALVWHAALSFPTGEPRRTGWTLSAAWMAWAVVGGVARLLWGNPLTMRAGDRIEPLAGAPEIGRLLVDVVPRMGDVLIVLSLTVLIGRMVRGDRPTRRAMAPLLVIVPIVVLTVVDETLVRAEVVESSFLAASTWAELATLAVPYGIVAGLARSRLWGGEVAGLVAAAEGAATPEEVERVAADTLGDPSARLGLVRPGTGTLVTVQGAPLPPPEAGRLRRPLVVDGERIGVLDHAVGVPAALAEQTAATIGLAVDRQRLQTEVRAQMTEVVASRRRVVAAADEARRRIERDLHDGAQQRLLALTVEAERLRRRLEAEGVDGEVVALAESLGIGAKEAHAELRDLARGMYPPMLEAEGLAPALEALADQSASSGVAVRLSAPDDRLPAEIEGTFYFVAAEALTNATIHSGASAAEIELVIGPGTAVISVVDDGRGGASVGAGGTGLMGLADRVSAVGGTLTVDSPPGGPTVVSASVPL
jgi:signal transduction histidine kinase